MKMQNLLNAAGEQVLPVTHEKLVFDDNGVRLSDKLANLVLDAIGGPHAASHAVGGTDPLTPRGIGALPLDGSVPMTGDLQISNGNAAFIANDSSIAVEHRSANDTRYGFVTYISDERYTDDTRFKVFKEIDGVLTQYDLIHTGNLHLLNKLATVEVVE